MTPAWPALPPAIAEALEGPLRRLQAIDLPDGRVWLKRAEELGFLGRLQKGDPRRSLEAERTALHLLGDRGLPVPPLLAEGPDWLVLPHLGASLATVMADPARPQAERSAAMAAAGRALARLHLAGFAHGRPALRDICWNGAEAVLIDFEQFRPRPASAARQGLDLMLLAQTWFTRFPEDSAGLAAAMAAYRQAAGEAAPAAARRLARRLGWLAPLASALLRLRPGSRELRAAPLTLGWLRGQQPPG